MDVTVSARHIDISPALRAAAEDKLGRLSRFGADLARVVVHFVEERNPRIAAKEVCEVTLEGRGFTLRAKGAAPDTFAAIDVVVEKLEHQLHSTKTKLLARQHGARREATPAATATVDD